MTDPTDDLIAALRRELAGMAVAHDDSRADAIIGAATTTEPLGARSWAAPLAAAAVVAVVGGGAAVIAAAHGGGSSPSGDGPAACPPVSGTGTYVPSTTAPTAPTASALPPLATDSDRPPVELQTVAPSPSTRPTDPIVTATPSSSTVPEPATTTLPGAEPCTSAPNSSADYPLPPTSTSPTSTSPTSTSTPLPSAGVGTPSEAPASTTFVIAADPGTTASHAFSVPVVVGGSRSTVFAVEVHRNSGDGGTLRAYHGSHGYLNEDIGTLTESTAGIDVVGYVQFPAQDPPDFELSCTGTTICSVRVTLDPALPAGKPVPTATPSTTTTPSR